MTMKTRLVIRHTLNFIFHQMLLSLAVIIPVALYSLFIMLAVIDLLK